MGNGTDGLELGGEIRGQATKGFRSSIKLRMAETPTLLIRRAETIDVQSQRRLTARTRPKNREESGTHFQTFGKCWATCLDSRDFWLEDWEKQAIRAESGFIANIRVPSVL